MNNSKSNFEPDESNPDEIVDESNKVEPNTDDVLSPDDESAVADKNLSDASSDVSSIPKDDESAVANKNLSNVSSDVSSIPKDDESAVANKSLSDISSGDNASIPEDDDVTYPSTVSSKKEDGSTVNDATDAQQEPHDAQADADDDLSVTHSTDKSTNSSQKTSSDDSSKKDTGSLPLHFDTDTAIKASSDDSDDEDTPTSAFRTDKRRTVLTFGVSEDEDSTKQHDTAILSENNSGLRRAISSQSSSTMPDGTATLGENREVILVIRGMIERLILNPDIRYKLGRFELGTKGLDEIDLTPYGALDRGVSRLHAELLLQEGRLFIVDLDSSNGTYIAGRRLPPHETIPLRKGDELMLGRLPMQVLFR